MKTLRYTLLLFILFASAAPAQDEARLLRFPTIHGSSIVFTYAGDLYTVPSVGGIARRLTSDIGYEMFAQFSPDGLQIAFTGQYDGNTEVYVMPALGGVPKRITITPTLSRDDVADRMGPNNIVLGWRDNETVVFRSRMKEWNSFKGHLYLAPTSGAMHEQIPLPRGGWCSYSPDGKKLAYNRVFREFRTWKRYRGGQADDIWIYDFDAKTTERITNDPAQDIFPMWAGNTVYFVSDRGPQKRFNLYSYDLGTKQLTRHTNFDEFDIKFPTLGDNAIVFENGGYIYRFDLGSKQAEKVPIQILEDFDSGRGGLTSVKSNVTNYEISPDGKRALFGARGDVFTVPAEHGNTRNITNTPGIHERNSKWSPDGKWISYISDEHGDDDLYVSTEDGSEVRQLTKHAPAYRYQPYWSPDSKKLLWSDREQNLYYIDVDSKQYTLVDSSIWEITQYTWSPDSKWIAYTKQHPETMSTVNLYSLETGEIIEVTEGWFNSGSPAFSDDGKYLFFVSARTFNPSLSWTELNHIYRDMTKIYYVTLAKETKSLFEPRSDEVKIEEDTSDDTEKDNDEKKDDSKAVTVNADGIASRIGVLPIKPGAYRSLTSVGNTLYYVRSATGDGVQLCMYDFDEREEKELGKFGGYEISADKKKMIVGAPGGRYSIVSLPKSEIKGEKPLDLSGMKVRLNRHAEWEQIFNECWRQMRDFFYDPGMHGFDWEAMRHRYEPLVKHVNHRKDLTYVIGEMIGELNVGHAYVGGGDVPKVERVKLGLLGAEITRDASGYYRIDRILDGQNWYKEIRSPLTEIGVDANEGDYIIKVNGEPTNEMPNIYAALIDKADEQVELTLSTSPSNSDTRTTTVLPIDDEHGLYYFNWVQDNIRKVNDATNGRAGYIHIPDMSLDGMNEFMKYFYPQMRKDALIIDVRGNGGGFASPMIIERLRRVNAMVGYARNSIGRPDPTATHIGPKVCLLDEFSASDGDIFPHRFRFHGLGKLIGKRSWGGIVGIRGSLPLLDGGFLNRPEFAHYDAEGTDWFIEGHGVDPDIVVDNDPAKEWQGIDEQLNRAIEEIKKELKTAETDVPPPPPFPNKAP